MESIRAFLVARVEKTRKDHESAFADLAAFDRVERLKKEIAQKEIDFASEAVAAKPMPSESAAVDPGEAGSMSKAALAMVGDEWIAVASILADIKLNYKVTDQAVHVALNRWIKKGRIQRRGKRGHFSVRRRAQKEAPEA